MTSVLQTEFRLKCYLDSVALMRHSSAVASLPGVEEAAIMMATPANVEIMQQAGLLEEVGSLAAGDLIISVRASDRQSAVSAMQKAAELLDAPSTVKDGAAWQPRTLRSAVQKHPDANIALVSVPGAFAISEARKAIRQGLHVMIFSDNVPLEQEVELKHEARTLGCLVMGPDCGTAVVNGIALAFANKLQQGPVSIVGASGTGIQEVSTLLSRNGLGVSHALGVGGRDLHQDVGGISTEMAMDILESDKASKHIILISKPPAPVVMRQILNKIERSAKPYTVCFLGGEKPDLPANCLWASTLSETAYTVLEAIKGSTPKKFLIPDSLMGSQQGKCIRGLFSGGTLCTEACVLLSQARLDYSSNVSLVASEASEASEVTAATRATVANGQRSLAAKHSLLDLGADEFTQGKPHPMIEPQIRDAHVTNALNDVTTGVLLVDIVIGYGAHADPASVLINSINSCKQSEKLPSDALIIASVTGTDDDPQSRQRQVNLLENANVVVADSNSEAVKFAIAAISSVDPKS